MSSGRADGPQAGTGVAVFETANGDRLVGVATLQTDAGGNGQIAFSWRDSVRFSNGTVVASTGQFARSRPSGAVSPIKTHLLVTVAIIAILIGL